VFANSEATVERDRQKWKPVLCLIWSNGRDAWSVRQIADILADHARRRGQAWKAFAVRRTLAGWERL